MSDSIDQKLNKYQSSASVSTKKMVQAAGFGAVVATGLLSASQAEADIIFNPGFTSGVFATASALGAFDIDGDGNNDIAVGIVNGLAAATGTTPADSNGALGFFSQGTKGGLAFQGAPGAYPSPYQQAVSGGNVSAGNVAVTVGTGVGWMGWVSGGATTSDAWGAFANPGVTATGIVGLQFNGSTKNGATNATMNAWMNIQFLWDDTVGANAGLIEAGELFMGVGSWAYNDDPTSTDNGVSATAAPGSIHIGATENFVAVPEPAAGTLALLALGALGVRRRKKAVLAA